MLNKKKIDWSKPYKLNSELFLVNDDVTKRHDIFNIKKDEEYLFEMKVDLFDEHKREELKNSFAYLVSAPTFDIQNTELLLEFDESSQAIAKFSLIPRRFGENKIIIDVLQNFHSISTLETSLNVV